MSTTSQNLDYFTDVPQELSKSSQKHWRKKCLLNISLKMTVS